MIKHWHDPNNLPPPYHFPDPEPKQLAELVAPEKYHFFRDQEQLFEKH
ncbi:MULTISPECIES: hypothetical protein [Photorhabdus]